MTNDGEDDPFKCPNCGSRDVECHGNGRRDCQSCPWNHRPIRDDPNTELEQEGLNSYQ